MDELDEIARMEIQPGWDVVDADHQPVGEVAEVHDASFTVRTIGAVVEIGFDDVESADDGRVTLAVSGDELSPDGDAA